MTDEGRRIVRPVPGKAGTEAEFALALRALKAWSGLSYREIESRARAAGLRLPFSTVSGMLRRDTLPREDLLIAYTTACGLDENEMAAWVTARKRLAIAAVAAPAPPTVATPAQPDVAPAAPVHPVVAVARPVVAVAVPARRRRLVLAACAVFVAAGALAAQSHVDHDVEVTTDAAQVQSSH